MNQAARLASEPVSESARSQVSVHRDHTSGYHFVAAPPHAVPDLWHEYISGALRAYRRFGVESALEYERVHSGETTALFHAALDSRGVVVGGLRAQGPYHRAEESHALREWKTPEETDRIRRMIEARIPAGVVEAKAAWVAEELPQRRELTLALAQMGAMFMDLLDVRFMMATAADNVLELWKTCGGVVDMRIPPTPYPDARYRTRLMWWDRRRSCGQNLAITAEATVPPRGGDSG
jgi:hypothetical protein